MNPGQRALWYGPNGVEVNDAMHSDPKGHNNWCSLKQASQSSVIKESEITILKGRDEQAYFRKVPIKFY